MVFSKKGTAAPKAVDSENRQGLWKTIARIIAIPAGPTRGITKFTGCFNTRPIVK